VHTEAKSARRGLAIADEGVPDDAEVGLTAADGQPRRCGAQIGTSRHRCSSRCGSSGRHGGPGLLAWPGHMQARAQLVRARRIR
jgi:hypothetical protein